MNKRKRQTTKQKKILTVYVPNEGLNAKIHKYVLCNTIQCNSNTIQCNSNKTVQEKMGKRTEQILDKRRYMNDQ